MITKHFEKSNCMRDLNTSNRQCWYIISGSVRDEINEYNIFVITPTVEESLP